MTAEPSGARAAGPVAERRVCSVLFCDVAGFTPLSEARDPEAVRELLSRYFEVARTVIGRYGDALIAAAGWPTYLEGKWCRPLVGAKWEPSSADTFPQSPLRRLIEARVQQT